MSLGKVIILIQRFLVTRGIITLKGGNYMCSQSFKELLDEKIYQMGELIKSVEITKERSKKTIEDCDKLIEEINEFIADLKKERDN